MNPEKHTFQAEVQQLLDIVIHSLYTDREIFVRELVSNAADSLEKLRHTQLTEKNIFEHELPLEISITTDDTANTLTIVDHGIGMTHDELVQNLGTIAHSGSKAFMNALKASGKNGTQLIGQFGVGFYSAFMVAKEVQVYTHSWRSDGAHLCWTSDGTTSYTIDEAPGQRRGCKIVVHLKDDARDFAKPAIIKRIIGQYSNFVGFPILVNGERVNNVEAIWLKPKSEVTDDQYREFYRFTAKAFDDPRYTFHFSADAPLAINALVFVPTDNHELYGMGQLEPGVSLYCKKVLIDASPPRLLPEWLRFLRGVIDSEDLPLNISRESMQDSALVRKLGNVVTTRFLKFLDKEAAENPEKFQEFYGKFSRFIKEGIATDHGNREAVAKLMRFESSFTEPGKSTTFAEYVSRMKDGQKAIYYQIAPSRSAIESGPYLEAFKARGFEVIYLFEQIDDYVVNSMREFDKKPLLSITSDEVELEDTAIEGEALSDQDATKLCSWLKESLGTRVASVRTGKRLVSSPAVALLPEGEVSPQMRQMMRALKRDTGMETAEVVLEINPRSALIKDLSKLTASNTETAQLISGQLLDNALLAAGLVDDPQTLIARSQKLMEALAAKG